MELFNKVTAGRLALPEKVRVNLLALGDVGSTLHGSAVEQDVPLCQIDAAGEQPDEGHNDIVDDGRGDLAEGGADDNADGHIHYVAAHGEGLKFVEKLLHRSTLLYGLYNAR